MQVLIYLCNMLSYPVFEEEACEKPIQPPLTKAKVRNLNILFPFVPFSVKERYDVAMPCGTSDHGFREPSSSQCIPRVRKSANCKLLTIGSCPPHRAGAF